MNRMLIYDYINTIRKEDIFRFGINQGIELEDYEIDIIYNYIKNDYKRIFDNYEEVLMEVKDKLKDRTYDKLVELCKRYQRFLS